MEFEEKLKSFVQRIEKIKDKINTEEATKTSIIMPFFQIMGYDIFNPNEFIPEYVADVGIKKGEKVDYAINIDNKITILIEAKPINEQLQKYNSQLFRYFGTTDAKVAILTNGIEYRFYTDLEQTNKMDETPFLQINLLEMDESMINELKKFSKENFDINFILNTASDLKYLSSIEKVLKKEFNNPSDEFTKLILNQGVYNGVKTQNVIDKYRDILKKSINTYINEIISDRLQNVIKNSEEEEMQLEIKKDNNPIITTQEEIDSYYIVKSILAEYISTDRINYKDTNSYFGILLDNKVTKWICRVFLKESVKFVIIAQEDKTEKRYDINSIEDIYKLKEELINRVNSIK